MSSSLSISIFPVIINYRLTISIKIVKIKQGLHVIPDAIVIFLCTLVDWIDKEAKWAFIYRWLKHISKAKTCVFIKVVLKLGRYAPCSSILLQFCVLFVTNFGTTHSIRNTRKIISDLNCLCTHCSNRSYDNLVHLINVEVFV